MRNYSASIEDLATQYKDSSNLAARQRIYRFLKPSSNPPWHRWVFDQLDVPAEGRILELGCGTGSLWKENQSRLGAGWRITLSDHSAGMLGDAKRALGDAATQRFAFEQFDAQAIPHAEATFDAVIANHMLYHVPDRPRAIGEIYRVLRPGGKLYAATNGRVHLKALRDLIDRGVASMPWEAFDESFRLENGAEQLRRFFEDVTCRKVTGELLITESQAIIDYALSIEWVKPILQGRKLDDFRTQIEDHLAGYGAFRVTTETGLFIASR